jgi:hypothetical protein
MGEAEPGGTQRGKPPSSGPQPGQSWGVKLEGARQQNLIITPAIEPEIAVDNIEVGQFIYLLLHNEKIRDVIDTITSKVRHAGLEGG